MTTCWLKTKAMSIHECDERRYCSTTSDGNTTPVGFGSSTLPVLPSYAFAVRLVASICVMYPFCPRHVRKPADDFGAEF